MLSLLQQHLEAIYATRAPDVRQFLVGREQVRQVLGDGARPADEWVLVREAEDGVDLALYVDPDHLAQLAAAGDPRTAVAECFRSFCAATEGISHVLLIIERALRGEPVRMLELEVQAEVDKFMCAHLHHPRRGQEWARRLFDETTLAPGLSPEETARYKEAGRLAAPFCRTLAALPHDRARLRCLRGFWRDSGQQRMDRLRKLAA